MIENLKNIKKISCGETHSLAIDDNEDVWACGANTFGQLGNGTTITKASPFELSTIKNVTMIACGANINIAICKDGTVWT
jgi:alpha-tubulin suppressor-like RCC1 family protein